MLARTQFGDTSVYVWGYNRLYIISVSYFLPAVALLVCSIIRILDSKVTEKPRSVKSTVRSSDRDTVATERVASVDSRRYVPEWLVLFTCISYIPVSVYSCLEHLQSHDVNVGLPAVGVSYILHLSLTVLRTILSYRWRQFRITITGIKLNRENRVSVTILSTCHTFANDFLTWCLLKSNTKRQIPPCVRKT